MNVRFTGAAVLAAILCLAPGAIASGEFADVYLRDGRHFFGKILEETEHKIVIEYRFGDIVSPMTFALRDVDRVDRKAALPENDDPAPPPPPPGGRAGYAIVPVEGTFGQEITAGFFLAAAREAERDEAEAIIFHLTSKGGFVSEMEPIRDALDEIERDMRVAFYVDDEAFSAAALVCLSSRELYVGPQATIGAAVAFAGGPGGAVEVDAKFNAAFAATWAAHADAAGRDPDIVHAMVEMERELWADTSATPWALHAERPAGAGESDGRFVQLDDDEHVLVLRGADIVSAGAADRQTRNPRLVPKYMKIAEPLVEATDGERFSDRYFRDYRNNMRRVDKALDDAEQVARGLGGADSRVEFRGDLRALKGSLSRVVSLYRQRDYVRNEVRRRGVSVEAIESLIREINRVLADSR